MVKAEHMTRTIKILGTHALQWVGNFRGPESPMRLLIQTLGSAGAGSEAIVDREGSF